MDKVTVVIYNKGYKIAFVTCGILSHVDELPACVESIYGITCTIRFYDDSNKVAFAVGV